MDNNEKKEIKLEGDHHSRNQGYDYNLPVFGFILLRFCDV